MHPLKNASIHELDQFVKRSTVADKKEEVTQFLLYFMTKNDATEEVKRFIQTLLHEEVVLNKIVIVSEHELYETVVTITNKDLCEPTLFHLYCEKAETIFLYIAIDEEEDVDALKEWRTHYQEKHPELVNLILDEYLLLKKWYLFTKQQKYHQKMEGWKRVLTLIQPREHEEKDR